MRWLTNSAPDLAGIQLLAAGDADDQGVGSGARTPRGGGEFRGFPKPVEAIPAAYDTENGLRLWQATEELTAPSGARAATREAMPVA
jgi:hypothetical protein